MTSPQRRSDPQSLGQGWELPLIAATLVAGGLILAALLGLGIAAALFGGGWVWPPAKTVGHVLGGILTQHPGRGLPPRLATRVPGPSAVYGCIAISELIWVALMITGAVIGSRYYRPSDARSGMATRHEAAQVLGIGQLHQARTLIRPDIHPTRRSTR